jgi:C4-dicarboxylate transporter DctQ subunit
MFLLNSFSRINYIIAWISERVIALILLFNMAIVFWAVICRYVLLRPQSWIQETAIFLMVWAAFIGSSIATRKKMHVKVTFLSERLPLKYRNLLDIIIYLLIILFLIIIIKYSITMIQTTKLSRSPSLRIPMYWVYSSVPVGSALILLQTLENFIRNIFHYQK